MTRLLLVPLAALAVLLAPGSAAAEPTVTEFAAGATTNSPPVQVTAGPSGSIWAVGTSNPGRVVSMTPEGAVTEIVAGATAGFSKDKQPAGIALGPDGNLWVVELGNVIVRLTPAGVPTEFAGGSAGVPSAITAGPDGRMWFTEQGGNHAIARINTDGTGLTEFTTGLTVKGTPSDIVTGADGNLWFTETSASEIGRITPSGTITEYPLTPGRAPRDIAVGPDGALWFTESGSPGGIGRITTSGLVTEYSTALISTGTPYGIARGADDAMWFTLSANPGAIGRIAADGTIATYARGLTPNQAPQGIAAGADGAMWFAESVAPGRLARITVPPLAGVTSATASAVEATLSSTVQANGATTTYRFDYGPVGGAITATPEFGAGAGTSAVAVSTVLRGLAPSTAYEARLVATSDGGTSTGPTLTFTTEAPPADLPKTDAAPDPVPPGTTPADGIAPADAEPGALPTLGKAVVVRAAKGVVMVKSPGQAKPTALAAATTLPVGTLIDARKGEVSLDAALDAGGVQTGRFSAGTFYVRQSPAGHGMTDVVLAGSSFAGCRLSRKLAVASKARRRSRVVRRLWGSDAGGRFRTHGRDSISAVRGTRWLTEDRCDGTLTKVAEGAVDVRPRGAKRSVRVRAGHSYLARHAR